MTILLVNDDGYTKEGIRALERQLAMCGHDIWVVAPSSNRSAQSHAMCLRGPVSMTRYGENHYHCSGSPTDCILYAIKGSLFPHLPDLVISGINHGYNCSSDILYSGTCSAASEAVLQGVRGIAVSAEADCNGDYDFDSVASFIADNLVRFYSLCSDTAFVNLNFPPHFSPTVVPSPLGMIYYGDRPTVVSDDGTTLVYEMKGEEVARSISGGTQKTDLEVCLEGNVSLSVILVNPAPDSIAHEKAALLFS